MKCWIEAVSVDGITFRYENDRPVGLCRAEQVTYVTTVPKEVFHPRPKVDSAVIRLDLRKQRPVDLIDEELFFEVIKGGFGQRRKTLHNALTGVRGKTKEEIAAVLAAAGIESNRRAETLSIAEFAAIANTIAGE